MTIKIVEAILTNISDSGIEYHIVHLTDGTFSIVANKVQGWKLLQQPLLENPEALQKLFNSWKVLAETNTPNYFLMEIIRNEK